MRIFNGPDVLEGIPQWMESARTAASALTDEDILNLDLDKFVTETISDIIPVVPVLDLENIRVERTPGTGMDAGKQLLRFRVPYQGDYNVFYTRPQNSKPGGLLFRPTKKAFIDDSNELWLELSAGELNVRAIFDTELKDAIAHLHQFSRDIEDVPKEIDRIIRNIVLPKRKSIEEADKLVGAYTHRLGQKLGTLRDDFFRLEGTKFTDRPVVDLGRLAYIHQRQFSRRFWSPLARYSDRAPLFIERELVTPNGSRIDTSQLIQVFPRALIIGQPGIGKTTFLERIAERLGEDYIASPTSCACPLFLRPGDVLDLSHGNDFLTALASHVSRIIHEPIRREDIRDSLENGRIFLLVDALDELLDHEGRGRLTDLFRQFPNMRGIVTSRPISLAANLRDFPVLSLAPFDHTKVESVLRDRWESESLLIEGFLQQLHENPAALSLLQNPMMTQLCVDVFEAKGKLPRNRSEIFQDFIDMAIDREYSRAPMLKIGRGELLAFYGAVAEFLSATKKDRVSNAELRSIVISKFGRKYDFNLFVERGPGFLVQWAEGYTSFVHRSLEEYFLAWEHRSDIDYFVDFLKRGEGRAVAEFAAGLVQDVSPLVEAAVQAGMLTDAVTYLDAAKVENAAVEQYVLNHFRSALGRPFLAKLTSTLAVEPVMAQPTELLSKSIDDEERLLNLLDEVTEATLSPLERGRRFEEFCIAFLSRVFKIVDCRAILENGEVDIMVENTLTGPFWADYGGDFVVECKNLKDRAPVHDVGAFVGKVTSLRVKLAFMISVNGFTDFASDVFSQQSSNPAATLIVPITGSELREMLRTRHDVEDFLKRRVRSIKYKYKNRNEGAHYKRD